MAIDRLLVPARSGFPSEGAAGCSRTAAGGPPAPGSLEPGPLLAGSCGLARRKPPREGIPAPGLVHPSSSRDHGSRARPGGRAASKPEGRGGGQIRLPGGSRLAHRTAGSGAPPVPRDASRRRAPTIAVRAARDGPRRRIYPPRGLVQGRARPSAYIFCSSIHSSMYDSSTESGRAPLRRIASWNFRMSKVSPSAARARALISLILSSPIL